ncbi:MAG TPA: hypothetical protein VGG26_06870 [Terracidiphilus sp.]
MGNEQSCVRCTGVEGMTGFGAAEETRPVELRQEHNHEKKEQEKERPEEYVRENEAAFVRWIIANLTEKEPSAGEDRGYIW